MGRKTGERECCKEGRGKEKRAQNTDQDEDKMETFDIINRALSPVVLSPAFLRKPLPHEQQWVAAKNEHQKSCAFRILAHISLQLLFYDL